MSNDVLNNKRIAKNTVVLYVRMLVVMLVSLYTSRVILSNLGVQDFGIYNVVGGIISMLSFINSSMSACTQRFLTYELAKGNSPNLNRLFSISLQIHFVIAIVIVLLVESFGLYFLFNKLQIPSERLDAAFWVLQISLLSSFFSIMCVPYNAAIISHEKMTAFAYIGLLEVFSKLFIVYFLAITPIDKLITYALLLFFVQIVIRGVYISYCKRHFDECVYHFVNDKKMFSSVMQFAGWDLYGNMSVLARTQGINILANMFFGPAFNAAIGISHQVQSAVMKFVSNVIVAVRPQIVKSYSVEDFTRMNYLLNRTGIFVFLIMLTLSAPLIIEMPYVLNLWLKNVPDYAVVLCRLTLLFNLIATSSSIVMIGIHASGKILKPSFINGTLYLLVVPISYISYKLGANAEFPLVYNVIAVCLGYMSNVYTLHLNCNSFDYRLFLKNVVLVNLLMLVSFLLAQYAITIIIDETFSRLVLNSILSITLAIIACFFLLNEKEKETIMNYLNKWKTKLL